MAMTHRAFVTVVQRECFSPISLPWGLHTKQEMGRGWKRWLRVRGHWGGVGGHGWLKEKGENIWNKAGWDEGDERKTRDAELLNKGRHAATATPALMAGESMLDEPYYVAKTVFDSRATHNKMSKHGVEVRIHIEESCSELRFKHLAETEQNTAVLHRRISRCASQFCGGLTTSCLILATGSNVLVPVTRWLFRAQSKDKLTPAP